MARRVPDRPKQAVPIAEHPRVETHVTRTQSSARTELRTPQTVGALELRRNGAGDFVLQRREAVRGETETILRLAIGDESGLKPKNVEITLGRGINVLLRAAEDPRR